MSLARRSLILLGFLLLAGTPARAQGNPHREGFWASIQLGYGSLITFSDQEPHDRRGTFALGFDLGGSVNPHVRLGVRINGWLLEASDLWDPEKGASVSQVLATARLYPWSARGLFLTGGVGRAIYTDHDTDAFGSSGWGGSVGVGYEGPAFGPFSVTPVLHYSRGSLGQVDNVLTSIWNRRYRVLDFAVGLTYR